MADFAIGLDGQPLFDESKLMSAINSALDDGAKSISKDYLSHQRTWSSKSQSPPVTTKGKWFRVVEVKGKIFRLVDWGRKARTIRPKRAKVLRFKSDYKRKTKQGIIPSGDGGASGEDVYAKQVKQKASKPSLITKTIIKKTDDEFPQIMDKYIGVN